MSVLFHDAFVDHVFEIMIWKMCSFTKLLEIDKTCFSLSVKFSSILFEKHIILSFSIPVCCGNLTWLNLKGLAELVNLTVPHYTWVWEFWRHFLSRLLPSSLSAWIMLSEHFCFDGLTLSRQRVEGLQPNFLQNLHLLTILLSWRTPGWSTPSQSWGCFPINWPLPKCHQNKSHAHKPFLRGQCNEWRCNRSKQRQNWGYSIQQ